jgi:hypothetical protein
MILGDAVHLCAGIKVRYHAINERCARGRRLTVATSLCTSTTGLDSADMEPVWQPFQEPAARKVWLEVLRPVAAEMQTCAPQLAGTLQRNLTRSS